MTPTKKLNLMLATSGLAGLAGLASLTLGVNEANAACTLTSGVLICDAADPATDEGDEISAKIAAEPVGNISVKIINGPVDIEGGDGPIIVTGVGKFDGVVTFVNAGTIGKFDATVTKYAEFNLDGVTISGDPSKTGNNISYTNDGVLNGNLVISNSGGTTTVAINKDVNSTLTGTGGNVTVTNATGGATYTQAAGTKVTTVSVDSFIGAAPVVSTATTNGKSDFTGIAGGKTDVTIAGDVGTLLPPATKFDPFSGALNPDVFTPGSVALESATGSNLTLAATAKVGAVGILAGGDTVTKLTESVTVSGVKTDTVVTTTKVNANTASYTAAAGAVQGGSNIKFGTAGSIGINTFGGAVTFDNAGLAAQGVDSATDVKNPIGLSQVTINTGNGTNQTNSSITKTKTTVIETENTLTASTVGAAVNFTNSGTIGTAALPAPVTVTGIGFTGTNSGVMGNLTVNGGAVTVVAKNNSTFEDVTGKTLTVNTLNSTTNISKDISLTTATGSVISTALNNFKAAGSPTVLNTGANVTVNSSGRINGLTVDATVGAANVSTAVAKTFDAATGTQLTEGTTKTTVNSGGDIVLNIFGNISGAGAAPTTNTLTATGHGNITADLKGAFIGNTTLTTVATDESISLSSATPIGKAAQTTNTTTRTATGGAVDVKIATGVTIGNQAGNAVVVNADGNVKLVNDGKARGNVNVTTNRSITTRDNNSSTSIVTQSGPNGGEITTTTATKTLNTTVANVGGTADVANNSLTSVLGSINVNALGGITFKNPGFTSGNVVLTSQGTSKTVDNSKVTTTTSTPTVSGKGLTEGEILTVAIVQNDTSKSTPNGGSITGTYDGVVGLDNSVDGGAIDATAGTNITQTADVNSSIDLKGRAFVNVNSTAGALTIVDTTVASSSVTTTSDILNPAAKVFGSSASGSGTSLVTHTETTNGGTSTVSIAGAVGKNLANATTSVNSKAHGASTVSVAGSVVGDVNSTSAATNVSNSTKTDTVTTFVGPTASALATTKTTTTSTITSNNSTVAGGAALVDLTGAGTKTLPTVGGSVTATGQTTATVNVGSKSNVLGNVTATVNGADTSTNSTVTAALNKTDTTSKVSATSGASTVKADGTVGGSVTATALSGAATALINNTVGGSVVAQSNGVNSATTTTKTFTAGVLTSSSGTTVDQTGVGGAATVTTTAPAGLLPTKTIQVNGSLTAAGGTSGTVTIGAGSIINGNASATAVQNTKNKSSFTTTIAAGTVTGTTTTGTFVTNGGTALLQNNGQLNGSGVAQGATATANNTGIAGDFFGGDFFGANAILEDVSTVTTVTSQNVPVLGSTTVVQTFTPQTTGKATVSNTGSSPATLYAFGPTGTITNAAGAAAMNALLGTGVNNYARTTVTTPTSTSDTIAVNKTLFVQNYTLDQNGLMEFGIDVAGAVIGDPLGTANYLKTSDVKAVINLNNGSVTSGGIRAEWEGLGSFFGPSTGAAATGLFLTNTTVNMNGTGFLGHDGAFNAKNNKQLDTFVQAPTFNALQEDFHDNASNGVAWIEGVTALNHTGPGTFYIFGRDHVSNSTPTRLDDQYTFRVGTFTNVSGRVEFAHDGGDDGVFSVHGNTVNNGEFVLGHTEVFLPPPNLSTLLDTQTFIDGENFLFTGNFTQGATGTLFIGGTPSLLRGGFPLALGVGNTGAPEVLGYMPSSVGAPPFTVAGFTGDDSFALVEGNLNLAGKIVVANQRGGLIGNGEKHDVFRVTGTVTNTATVTPLFGSNFVTYELISSKSGTDTILSLNTKRTALNTQAGNSNAANAADALDADLAGLIKNITDDANGLKVYSTVQEFNEAQDLANTVAGLDWILGLPDVPAALDELASGDLIASLNGIDHSAQFNEAVLMNSMGIMEGGGRLWASPAYRTITVDGDASTGAGEIKSSEAGLFFGGSFQPTEAIGWGVAFGYQGSEVDGEQKPASAEINTYLVGANLSWRSGPIRIGGGLTYSASNIEARRHLEIFARDITADYDSHSVNIDVMGSYDFEDVMGGVVTPYIRVVSRNISTDAFRESQSGGGIALAVDKYSETATTPEIGVFYSRQDWDAGFGTINPYVGLSILFNDYQTESTQTFVGGSTPFKINGVDPSTSAQLSGGFSGGIGDLGSFSLGLTGQFGDISGVGANATFKIHFD